MAAPKEIIELVERGPGRDDPKDRGQRCRCSMMSAITNRGRLCFRVFKGHLNSDVFIDFMRRFKRQSDRKIFLIVDRQIRGQDPDDLPTGLQPSVVNSWHTWRAA